jgi:hypothetical protein
MPFTQPFYINGPSLSSSTAVFDDAALTICSPDGFYSDGIVTRQQIDCVLLPEQICTACCSDPCSGWNITSLSGTTTVSFESCRDQAVVEETFTGPFDEDLCVVYGTIPEIISGKASLVERQDCGCCIQDCNTYRVFGISGSVTISYIDCLGVEQTDTFTTETFFCCKNNTTPTVISGTGFIGFEACGCEE